MNPLLDMDDDTRRAYLSRIRQYLAWLEDADLNGDPLTDPAVRDWAARDYRAHLLTVLKRKPTTVNAHLTAIDDFNRRIGLGPATAKRIILPNLAPRALDQRTQTRFLRAIEQSAPRDRAMGYTAFYAGTRIHELVALDIDDLHISARKGVLIIRMGKNEKYREVLMHTTLRTELDTYLRHRANLPGADKSKALFLNVRGGRLSARAATDVLNGIADRAGIDVGRDEEFTTHVLRHTLGTKLAREGEDVVKIAQILGHNLETARRYTLPTEADMQAAIDKLTVDE
ncbi:tyrosine-type recombinase/integrase [Nonomuraea sp. SYSU D8015]|uniref:tyrosine-type recombinase/integrase n=1 Tax=Nonomuraea sp. SYSU D8015 TaxID=2593644 RepID=UPI001660CC17|nr:tyrosine-type recombinase/integrase [Nonomuraea sp. SYSU D8015]